MEIRTLFRESPRVQETEIHQKSLVLGMLFLIFITSIINNYDS